MTNHDWPKPIMPWDGVVRSVFPLAGGLWRDIHVTQSSKEKENPGGEILGKVFLLDKMTLVRRMLPSFKSNLRSI